MLLDGAIASEFWLRSVACVCVKTLAYGAFSTKCLIMLLGCFEEMLLHFFSVNQSGLVIMVCKTQDKRFHITWLNQYTSDLLGVPLLLKQSG